MTSRVKTTEIITQFQYETGKKEVRLFKIYCSTTPHFNWSLHCRGWKK